MSNDLTNDMSTGDLEEEELESSAEENNKRKRSKKKKSLKEVKMAERTKTEAMHEMTDATGTPAINNGKCKLTEITGTSKNGE